MKGILLFYSILKDFQKINCIRNHEIRINFFSETKPDAPVNKGPVSLGFNSDSSPQLLQTSDYVLCLLEQFRTYNAKMEDLKKMFPVKDDKKFLSFADASLVVCFSSILSIILYFYYLYSIVVVIFSSSHLLRLKSCI